MNVGTVVANVEETIIEINRSAAKVTQMANLVFFMCLTQQVLKSKTPLNNNLAKRMRNKLIFP